MPSKDLRASIVQAGDVELGTLGDAEVGIWEMSAGAMRDIESDEYFAVLSGRATVQILEAGGFGAQELRLVPGSVARLHAGMSTLWTVTETLRKIYFTL
ncbi:cupin domain-containing protein [Glutamicibacter nicotianae]|uniref:cupin domain-containing protein n=1 Tax=Glutamicibacter nicotianae TaxID=37929 RepID=UPI000EF8DCCD|nr:cupin domain-containing protein [Glutamicibacter nicotianae]